MGDPNEVKNVPVLNQEQRLRYINLTRKNDVRSWEKWIQEWKQTELVPLGAACTGEFLGEIMITMALMRKNTTAVHCLLDDLIASNYPLSSLKYGRSNLLHCAVSTGNDHAATEIWIKKILETGFPVALPDLDTSERETAALGALKSGNIMGFSICLSYYTQEEWDGELSVFLAQLQSGDRGQNSQWAQEAREVMALTHRRLLGAEDLGGIGPPPRSRL